MNETEMEERVAAIAEHRVRALRARATTDLGARLLAKRGSVTATEVEELLAAEWSPPDERQLTDMVAAKLQASLDVYRREALAAQEAVVGAESKVAKYEELLAAARADLAAAEASDAVDRADAAATEAIELLAYLQDRGADPRRAPAGDQVPANAGVAMGKAV